MYKVVEEPNNSFSLSRILFPYIQTESAILDNKHAIERQMAFHVPEFLYISANGKYGGKNVS